MKSNFQHLHWPLIIGMGALALSRPLMNISGMMDGLGRPFGPIFMTVLISVIWLAIVVLGRVRDPLLTLTFTGIAYGAFAIGTSAILSPILTGALAGPITNPIAFVMVLITNAIWGGFVGVIAWGMQQVSGSKRAS